MKPRKKLIERCHLPIAGTWSSKASDKPDSAWTVQCGTPASVAVKTGEVYRFVASPTVSAAELESLPLLKNFALRELSICDAPHLEETDLSPLGEFAELHRLELNGTHAAELGFLRSFSLLRVLLLSGTDVNDSGLANVARCTELELLDLFGCSLVTSEGVQHLSGLHKLAWLCLKHSQVDDSAIPSLLKLPGLNSLEVEGSCVTSSGEELIERALSKEPEPKRVSNRQRKRPCAVPLLPELLGVFNRIG